jgi:hypothetical protein
MQDDPADIARRLSPAQKRALLWLPGDGSDRPWYAGSGNFDGHKDLRGMALASGKADRHTFSMMRWATPLGLRVRALLEQETPDAR